MQRDMLGQCCVNHNMNPLCFFDKSIDISCSFMCVYWVGLDIILCLSRLPEHKCSRYTDVLGYVGQVFRCCAM